MLSKEDLDAIDRRIEAAQYRTSGIVIYALGFHAIGILLFLFPLIAEILGKWAMRYQIRKLQEAL